MRVGGEGDAPEAFTPGKGPVTSVQEPRLAPVTILTGTENLASAGVRTPNRQPRSKSLHRLSYPGSYLTI